METIARRRRDLFTAFAIALLIGCGGDSPTGPNPDPDPDPDPDPHTELTVEERHAAIDDMEAQLDELGAIGLPVIVENEIMAAWLESRPEFEAAGVDEGSSSVWARFTDGRLLIISNNRFPDETDAGTSAYASLRRAGGPAAAAGELPSNREARIMHAFGAGFAGGNELVKDLVDWAGDAGYAVRSGATNAASVETLRNLSGDGLLFLNAHGGRGDSANANYFSVQTSTLVDRALDGDPVYAADLATRRLVYHTARNGLRAPDGTPRSDTRYGITHLFVTEYMSFGENSVVFMNVCYSGHSNPAVRAFADAVNAKGGRHYLGWTNLTSSTDGYRAVRYFFDRVFGANEFEAEDPEQRPFDVAAVLDHMKAEGISVLHDSLGNSELVLRPASVNAILRPSIYGLEAAFDTGDTLVIHGSFGAAPAESEREVSVGGTPVEILSWEHEEIRVRLPRTGPGAQGDVVVRSHGRESNPRALVAWRGQMRFRLEGPGTLQQTLEFDLFLRGDPDQSRASAGSNPSDLPWPLQPIANAAGTYGASGSYTFNYPMDDCSVTDQWSGSGTLDLSGDMSAERALSYFANVASGSRTIELYIVAYGSHTYTTYRGSPCEPDSYTFSDGINLPHGFFTDGHIPLQLGENYEILPGRLEAEVELDYHSNGETATATLEWDLIPATPGDAADQPK